MRFGTFAASFLSFAALTLSVVAEASSVQEVVATAAFPDTNAFSHVVNGQKNTLKLTVENKLDRNVTLTKIAGALLHPETNALIKNLTSQKYTLPLLSNVQLSIPYTFYSEFKPGDHRLSIWLEHASQEGTSKVEVYDSIITVVDPEFSIFDFKLLSTYAVVAALLPGLIYVAFRSFVPQGRKPRSKKPPTSAVSAPVGTVTATGAGGYQEEWIPEHHLRKPKSGRKIVSSGGETSGTEEKKTKVKK